MSTICACGHPEAQHETAIRDGLAWFVPEALTSEQRQEADEQERVWHFCGECCDGCHRVSLVAVSSQEAPKA